MAAFTKAAQDWEDCSALCYWHTFVGKYWDRFLKRKIHIIRCFVM
jgi:hypothetical protein